MHDILLATVFVAMILTPSLIAMLRHDEEEEF